jgi:hypothetical protein
MHQRDNLTHARFLDFLSGGDLICSRETSDFVVFVGEKREKTCDFIIAA